MLYLLIAILCLFLGYYIFAEYRIHTLMKQRNHWHTKLLDYMAEERIPIEPEDECASVIPPHMYRK